MKEKICSKVYYDNIYGYRYIVNTYKNNVKTLTILTPYNNAWFKTGPINVTGKIFVP